MFKTNSTSLQGAADNELDRGAYGNGPCHGNLFAVPLSGVNKNILLAFEAESHMGHIETHSELKHGLVKVVVDHGCSE